MKIFCIGPCKTGTTSLPEALRIPGYAAVHRSATKRAFRYTDDGGIDIDRDFFERHDAFAVTAIARLYFEFEPRYPDAKFILTLRAVDAWLAYFADQCARGGLFALFFARANRDLDGTVSFKAHRCRAALA
jgi:hypothetical protein